MATSSPARRFLAFPSPFAAAFAFAAVVLQPACSSDDDDSPAAPSAGSGGSQGGTSGAGGTGAHAATGGAAGAIPSVGGTASSVGGTASSVGGTASSVGGTSSGSSGTLSMAGKGGKTDPPMPNDDGSSPYERECHGDTSMCADVDVLRCLGIRDDSTIYGYSCSNTCDTDADCSDAPASGKAQAGCVDFVTQKHCLLVCLSDGEMHSCPDGMGCYVYPQTTIGYCLWQ